MNLAQKYLDSGRQSVAYKNAVNCAKGKMQQYDLIIGMVEETEKALL